MVPVEHDVNIANRSLFALEAGSGNPTVIFDAGLGGSSSAWHGVQAEIAKITRTVSYDRAGRGQSKFDFQGRTLNDCVQDLEALLLSLHVEAPCVLVGHSFGGLVARFFAHRFPDKSGGIVLVDSAQEDAIFGFQKTLGVLSFPPRRFDEPQWLTGLRFHQSQHLDPAFPKNLLNDEGIDLVACYSQVREVKTLGDLPLTVISSTKRTYDRDAGATGVYADSEAAAEKVWIECQRRLLDLSTNSTQILATESQHYIQNDQPALVVSGITEMIELVRRKHVN